MKYLLILFILLSIYSCGNDTVNNGSITIGGNTEFDIYSFRINNALLRYEAIVVKEDGTNNRLFNDSLFVLCSSVNDKILLGKVDNTGFSISSLYSASQNGSGLLNIPITGYYPFYFDINVTGDKALFTTDAGNFLCVINTNGTGLIQLSDGIRGTEEVPRFSPDGKLIAYFEAQANFETGLYISNTSGTYKKQLTDSIFYSSGFNLSWSPGGDKIVFLNRKDNLQVTKICIIDTSGNNYEVLTTGYSPEWSPNGNKISFTGAGTPGGSDLFLMNPDGSQVTNISNSENVIEGNEKWSRDGTKLLFSQQYSGNTALSYFIYEMNSGNSSFVIDSVYGCIWK